MSSTTSSTSSLSSAYSSSTGLLSSTGLGSGLNVTSIVSALVAAESIPLTSLQTADTALQTQLSTYGQLQSYMSALNDATQAIGDPTTFNQTTGTSSNPSAVNVSVGTNTPAGTYTVEVDQLAMPQSVASADLSSSSALVGAGTLSIQLGTQTTTGSTSTFANASSSAVNITVTSTDTLSSLASKINSSGAGVTASILNDGTGSRLVLSSTTTGAANGFSVTATDSDGNNTDANGLSRFTYDPTSTTSPMTEQQSAQDARAKINGMPVSSSINTLSQVLDGISLTLGGLTPTGSPATLTVAPDTAAVTTSINNFVTAYNQLNSFLTTQTAYNASTNTAGELQGDMTAISIRAQLRNMVGATSTGSSVYTSLQSIGFDVATDGTLSVTSSTLASALNNMSEVKGLFTSVNATTPTSSGIGRQLDTLTNNMLSTTGAIATKTSSINASITQNESDQSAWQTRIAAYQTRVQAQYSALDTQMSTLNSLSSYLTTQLASLASSNG